MIGGLWFRLDTTIGPQVRRDSPEFASYTPRKQLHWLDCSGGSSSYRYRHNMSHSRSYFSIQIPIQLCLLYKHLLRSAGLCLTVHRRSVYHWKPSPQGGVCEFDIISARTSRFRGTAFVARTKDELGALDQSYEATIVDVRECVTA